MDGVSPEEVPALLRMRIAASLEQFKLDQTLALERRRWRENRRVIKTGDAPVLDGPLGQVNWRAIGAGVPAAGAWEFAFDSDAHVTGEVLEGLGPFIMAALDAGVPL